MSHSAAVKRFTVPHGLRTAFENVHCTLSTNPRDVFAVVFETFVSEATFWPAVMCFAVCVVKTPRKAADWAI